MVIQEQRFLADGSETVSDVHINKSSIVCAYQRNEMNFVSLFDRHTFVVSEESYREVCAELDNGSCR